ncbi:MAG: hypothetical protein ABS965_01115 [Succiniclasticum sp.]|jgi:predicted Fe-S protein YdhL (DUF1289 family)
MMNWKKSLLVAGVLASLLAGSAFAATEAEDAATQQKGLEYNNKIEQNAPEMEKGRPGFHKDGYHRPGPRHGGFHKHHGPKGGPHHDGEFRGPKGGPGPDGKFCGPKGGPGHHHDGAFHKHHGEKKDRPGKLTQEQRQQLAKERKEFFANWQSMSDRERREVTEKFIHRVNEERMKNMTDAEKKSFEKRQAAKKAEREKIAKMTEDERHEYFKQKHDKMVKERTKHMTKEEKARFLERDKRQQERMEAFWKKWKQMTPEEKEQWKKAHHRFGPGPGQGMPAPR